MGRTKNLPTVSRYLHVLLHLGQRLLLLLVFSRILSVFEGEPKLKGWLILVALSSIPGWLAYHYGGSAPLVGKFYFGSVAVVICTWKAVAPLVKDQGNKAKSSLGSFALFVLIFLLPACFLFKSWALAGVLDFLGTLIMAAIAWITITKEVKEGYKVFDPME